MSLAICREDVEDKSIMGIDSLCWKCKGLLQRTQMYLILLILFELLSISCAKKTILFALSDPFEVLTFYFSASSAY